MPVEDSNQDGLSATTEEVPANSSEGVPAEENQKVTTPVDDAAKQSIPVEPTPPPPPKTIWDTIYETDDVDAPRQRIAEDIQGFINQSGLQYTYDFVFLYDERSKISRYTANRLYSAVTGPSRSKVTNPIFLLLHTNGGRVEPAYLISKCCKKTASKFVVVVPRFAKSAGTLLALGADEIHMGIISELGPIDPQIGDYPALGLGSAVDHIANLCKKHPDAVEMLAKYLASNLSLHDLGYFERVSESAAQYAERLLTGKQLPASGSAASIAHHFVYGYKDHGFVIDRDEASDILGPKIVKSDTPEYKLANQIHEYMDTVNFAYTFFKKHHCKILGTIRDGLIVSENRE